MFCVSNCLILILGKEPRSRDSRANKTSWVWDYFQPLEKAAKCSICTKTIGRSGGSTSGMKNHLKSIHSLVENVNNPDSDEEADVYMDETHSIFEVDSNESVLKLQKSNEISHCYICNELFGMLQNKLTVQTSFSGTPVYEILGNLKN